VHRLVPGGYRERREFVERGVVGGFATERDAGEQCEGAPGLVGGVQLSAPSCWKLTARAGTTVEMACL
jgi:hypothetical protein